MANKSPRLTKKQEVFCNEYIIDFNATRAAIAAGYSQKSATVLGHETLRKPYVQERLQKLIEKRAARVEITQDRVLLEISRIAFFDIRELYDPQTGHLLPIDELGEDTARALSSIDVSNTRRGANSNLELETIKRIRALDKKGALELLGKHLGMFTERQEVELTGKGGLPLEISIHRTIVTKSRNES